MLTKKKVDKLWYQIFFLSKSRVKFKCIYSMKQVTELQFEFALRVTGV